MPASELIVLVIDESVERGTLIQHGLRDAGHHEIVVLSQLHGLVSRIEEIRPDVIVMDLGNPNRDFLEHMFRVSKAIQKPIAMFVDQSSDQAMFDAIEAGVSAYVVDGLKRERVKPILDLAIARFKAFEKIRRERDEALRALDDRKLVDRAKGLLMKSHAITEDAAYVMLRSSAMTQGRKLGEIAAAVVRSARANEGKQK